MQLKTIMRQLAAGVSEHAPEILTGLGIAGFLTATVLAVKATPKAMRLIEEKKQETGEERLAMVEAAKTAWKCYVPTAIAGAASVGCILGASKVHHTRNAALATAYAITETALKEYKDKTAEVIGEKKEQEIRDGIAKDKIQQNPPVTREIVMTGKGDTLCYDVLSGRYFKSSIDKVEAAVNTLNRRMLAEEYISVNEYYEEIGLPDIAMGYDLGWNVNLGYIDIRFSAQLSEDDTPCLVIEHDRRPSPRYRKP